jgi:hypothetical protein
MIPLGRRRAGDEQRAQRWRYLAGTPDRLDPIHRRRQTNVGNEDVELIFFQQGKSRLPILGLAGVHPLLVERKAQQSADFRIIINDEHTWEPIYHALLSG